MTIQSYINSLNQRYLTGISREHAYRGDLQTLLTHLLPDILVINEPARVACGAPDYVLTRKDIPIGYVEAKDIGVDLKNKSLKEQFDRYRSGLSNLIFTDYMDFHFYKDGNLTTTVAIAKIENGAIIGIPENFETFENLIKNFSVTISQTIKSPTKLAEMMAGKAKLMADVIERSLDHDDENEIKSSLKKQMLSFKQMLIHDITNSAFADIYAQTIAYGMFAARYHDPTLPTFSRQEAATLIPKSNPFLRKLFQDIAGYDLDDRLIWIVDELVNIFLATDVADIMKNFGRSTKQEDPVVHFYETFLASYNPALRKARGVWYTPQPVVNFIVRAVDDILKTEFNLPQGLADTSKIKVKTKHVTKATADQRSKLKEVETEQEVHKVQILDPATGTGTFLAEVVKHIYKKFEGQQGIWSNYVNQHLIPRLNGFELLMASYAMAHLKMDMLLTETGYTATSDQRFRIFLTNSLEEAHPDTGTLFSSWLSDEADAANAIKRETPVMVIIGNPPYSVSSNNKSKWIEDLVSDYKTNLNEKNIQPLSDDYIKFIRFGQHFVDKNGSGLLAFISNNSFLDGLIHRQMRKNLLKSFNKIFILDLHGNSKKKETDLKGGKDENVFDIQQGVSINIFIKNAENEKASKIFQADLYGKREFKYSYLYENSLKTILWNTINVDEKNSFFVKKNFTGGLEYDKGFLLTNIFPLNASGIKTERDNVAIHFSDKTLIRLKNDLISLETEHFRSLYTPKPDGRDWKVITAKEDLLNNSSKISNIVYRPFDVRKTLFTGKSKGFHSYPRSEVMKHLVSQNYALIFERSVNIGTFTNIYVANCLVECHVLGTAFSFGYTAPLYIYPEKTNQTTLEEKPQRVPNLNMEIVNKIAESAGYYFQPEEFPEDISPETMQFYPIDILDYIYAVLHSPSYREKYKEFLKIDFPRVPYPTLKTFMPLAELGKQLRELHLLESDETEKYITQYPIDGNNEVVKPIFTVISNEERGEIYELEAQTNREIATPDEKRARNDERVLGKVYINETQYFDNVPEVAWNFYIGGYQPAQKWLKDRKGRVLEFDDILHYQKIIVALTRTSEIMVEIDKVMED